MIKHVNIPYGDSNFNISIVEDFEYKNPIEVYHNIIVNSNIQFNTTLYPNFEKEFTKRNIYLNETEKQRLILKESLKGWNKWYENIMKTDINPNLLSLINNKKSTQIKLLKSISIRRGEITAFIIKSFTDYGFEFSQYRTEYQQKNIEIEELNGIAFIDEKGEVNSNENTCFTEGQIKQAINHRVVTIAKFIDKGDEWHCFFSNYKSLGGKELQYKNGQKHIHYISSKWGLERDYVLNELKKRKYKLPSTPHLDLIDE